MRGLAFALALAGLIMAGAGYLAGYHQGSAAVTLRWHAEREAAALALAEARRANAEALAAAGAAMERDAAEHAALVAGLQSEIDAYARDLAARPPVAACALDDADVRRLRALTDDR